MTEFSIGQSKHYKSAPNASPTLLDTSDLDGAATWRNHQGDRGSPT